MAVAGEQHATIERKGQFWHIYVGGERRVTVRREMGLSGPGGQVFAAAPQQSPVCTMAVGAWVGGHIASRRRGRRPGLEDGRLGSRTDFDSDFDSDFESDLDSDLASRMGDSDLAPDHQPLARTHPPAPTLPFRLKLGLGFGLGFWLGFWLGFGLGFGLGYRPV